MLSSLSLMQSLEQRHHRYRAAATALSPTVLHLDRSRCAVCLHKTLWNSIAGMKRLKWGGVREGFFRTAYVSNVLALCQH